MIDWSRIAGFDWDEGNLHKSVQRHDVSKQEAEELFLRRPLLVLDDIAHSSSEQRFQALGRSGSGRYLFAAFTLRSDNTLIRVISIRDMNANERRRYEEEA